MKPFRFTLEVLRTLRRRQEQLALEAYAQSVRLRQQASQRLEHARELCEAAWRESQAQLAQGVTAAELTQAQEHAQQLERRCREAAQGLLQAEQKTQHCWEGLVAARRQVEIVEACFEKQRLRYQQACQREEQKFLDELAGRRQSRPHQANAPLEPAWN